jgi:peptidyl-tRNA hydrolase, PTH1 family
MKLIIGLGNPGNKYERTRHNAGFLAIDHYLKDKQPISCQSKFQAQICELHFGETKVLFIKPQTFMNNSGQAAQEICQFYKVDPNQDVLIIHDEIDLPFGSIRAATDSSPAGHNGVKDVFEKLGTQSIRRIRLGVESRESRHDLPTDVFVLQNFTDDEWEKFVEEVLPQTNDLIDKFIHG